MLSKCPSRLMIDDGVKLLLEKPHELSVNLLKLNSHCESLRFLPAHSVKNYAYLNCNLLALFS